MYSVYLLVYCSTMHLPYQRPIAELWTKTSIYGYLPFLLVHLAGFFQHVAYMIFECKVIVNNNTQHFLLQTTFNFNTIDIGSKIIRGSSCKSFSLTNKKVEFSWVCFHSYILKLENSSYCLINLHLVFSFAYSVSSSAWFAIPVPLVSNNKPHKKVLK